MATDTRRLDRRVWPPRYIAIGQEVSGEKGQLIFCVLVVAVNCVCLRWKNYDKVLSEVNSVIVIYKLT